ncbi:hypothetical protein AAVH_03582 [Aphelenchoides avenae]|nr:hypothetical protein AAVH_03582 [Aphelenchus avenae]
MDIAKGTLLMVSKAFACTYPDECDFLVLASNMLTENADLTKSFYNKMLVVQTLQTNAYRASCGDVIVVHAVDYLKKGEEVSVTYVDPQLSYKELAEQPSSFGFECQCELCILDRSDELCIIERKNESLLCQFGAEFYVPIALNMMNMGRGRGYEKYKHLIGQYVKMRAGITNRVVGGLFPRDPIFP